MPGGAGAVMETEPRSQRSERRTPMRVLVELCSFENIAYEVTHTVNVSPRGARILSKDVWKPGQRLSVRSIEGNLNSRGRIAYCHATESGTFAIGLELDQPSQGWGPASKGTR